MQHAQSLLEEIHDGLGALPPDQFKAMAEETRQATGHRAWVPNPGPQTEAFFCEADELFYGGQAGGGKTDLLVGLAVTEHEKSLVLRRTNKEAKALVERFTEVIGTELGLNRGPPAVYRLKDRRIDIGGCQLEEDKQKYKGDPHSLKGFDEVSDFTESQYVFIIAWNRSVNPGQRCRVVACGNPPTRPEGLWIIKRWAAWLDPRHPNPAKPGELRWYTTGEDGAEIEVDGHGPHLINNEEVMARSRTFIPAELADNPDLASTGYGASLDSLPPELRSAYRDGKFDHALRDEPWQAIPTEWILAAQDRWTPQRPDDVPMCAMGVDIAQGGEDQTILAPRYDGYYPELIVKKGKDTPDGKSVAGLVVSERRDGAIVVVDMGGGYGGSTYEILKENEIKVKGHKGAEASIKRTADQQLKFANKRAEVYWRFREALDPAQDGGSHIQLPPDPEIIADLTAPTFEIVRSGIKLETKEHLVKRLGRSPDKGDAIVMAWSAGNKIWNVRGGQFRRRAKPTVHLGHANMKKRRK